MGHIVEDDYDSEFRYEGRPVEAVQGLDRSGRVLYIGTFSKVLFPSLRIGYGRSRVAGAGGSRRPEGDIREGIKILREILSATGDREGAIW